MSEDMAAIARLLERRDDRRGPSHPFGWGPSPEVAERRRQRLKDAGRADDGAKSPVDCVARLNRRRTNAEQPPVQRWSLRDDTDPDTAVGDQPDDAVHTALEVMTRLLNTGEA